MTTPATKTDDITIVSLKDGLKFQADIASVETNQTYVAQYFEAHAAAPDCALYTITGPEFSGCEHCTVVHTVKTHYRASTITLVDAKLLLNTALRIYKAKLITEWKSFTVTIGKKDAEVHPSNILSLKTSNVKDYIKLDKHVETKTCEAPVDLTWLVMFYTAPYRLHNINRNADETYIDGIAKKISNMAQVFGAEQLEADSFWKNMKAKSVQWVDDPDYCKAVSALDMFFSKFKDLPESKLRICTITSRMKDCAAINELLWFKTMVKKPLNQAIGYMATSGLEEDIRRVLKGGNEMNKIDSYVFYGSSMGLFMSSPYSARINPSLHHFVNLLGACNNESRAMRSQVFEPSSVSSVMNYTLFVAHFVLGSAEIALKFASNDAEKAVLSTYLEHLETSGAGVATAGNKNKAEEAEQTALKDPTPFNVFKAWTAYNHVLPKKIKRKYMALFSQYDDADGRICLGSWLKSYATAHQNE